MAAKYREEIVGKRFLSVRSATKLKTSKLSEWEWRSGVIRAVTHKDTSHAEFTVLVEFDDCAWTRREWIRVHDIFHIFLVEFTLVWAPRRHPHPDSATPSSAGDTHTSTATTTSSAAMVLWPAISFQVIVDKSGFGSLKLRATEYVDDGELEFLEDTKLRFYKVGKFEDDDTSVESPARCNPEVRKAVRRWLEQQDGQSILLTTPSVLVGYRVEVYCAEGTRQWYTAVIHSYNENTRELSVTDDTVLEVHNEDPSMVQMKLIGDGVVESILKGENLGITPRRRSCNIRNAHRDVDSLSSSSLLARLSARSARSQSPSQSSPAQKCTVTRAKGRHRAAQCAPASSTSGAANHGPPPAVPTAQSSTANPPDTAPAKDEKEKPPDRGKLRTSQRERKRRSDDVITPPPAKQKVNEKDKDAREKIYRELTRTISVKAGSILPASTQPTVVVKPVRTLGDHIKLICDSTTRTRKAKEVQKETKELQPNRTGSPASGVRSRTPLRKDKEEKNKDKQQPAAEKAPTEPKRKTRESSSKSKESKRESKRLKEEDNESKDGSSKPPSPASSNTSACSSITSRLEGWSRTSTPTPTRQLDSAKRASPAPTKSTPSPSSSTTSSDLKKKDNNCGQATTQVLDPISGGGDRLQPTVAPQSTAVPTTVPSITDSCAISTSSSSGTKPTANTITTASCRTFRAAVSNTTTTTSSTNSSSSNSSLSTSIKTTPLSSCSTEVGSAILLTIPTNTLSCTTSTTTTNSLSTITSLTTTTTTFTTTTTTTTFMSTSTTTVSPKPSSLRTSSSSPNASSHTSTISRDLQSPATSSPAVLPPKAVLGVAFGQRGRVSSPKGTAAHQGNNSSGSRVAVIGSRQGGVGCANVSSPTLPPRAATLTTTTAVTTATTTTGITAPSSTQTPSSVSSSSSLTAATVTVNKSSKITGGAPPTSRSLATATFQSSTSLQSTTSSLPSVTSSSSSVSSSSSSVSSSTSVSSVSSFSSSSSLPASAHHYQRGGPVSSMSHISSRSAPITSSKLLPSSGRCDPAPCFSSSCSSTLSLSSSAPSGSLLSSAAKSYRSDEEPAMHYKKMILLDGYHKKEASSSSAASSQETFTAASGINVNHSLTDQIAKLSSVKVDRFKAWNNNDLSSATVAAVSGVAPTAGGADFARENRQSGRVPVSHPSFKETADRLGVRGGSLVSRHRTDKSRRSDESGHNSADRESAEMERKALELQERLTGGHPSEERSHSRSSADERRPSRPSSSASNSRVEELWRSAGSDAHAASPLIFDKNEPVRVYRDPELLKRDEMRYFQQRQQQEHSRHAAAATPTAVPPSASFQPGHPSPLGSPHHAAAALPQSAGQRPMLTPHPYSTHMNPLPALSPHMSMSPHHSMDAATLRVLSAMHYPLVPQYMHSTTQLEILWQQKYPTLPVPPAWMLVQYQEELLRDVNLIALERERREREIALERDRVEQAERERAAERDRADRERREHEREQREMLLERERERKHREEVAERERKREEAERLERERVEKERKEQERIKREQRERSERGHILKETAQAQAAVDQHFSESLRLASQKHAASAVPWPTGGPSITHGLPKHPTVMAVPPESLTVAAHHQSAFTHRVVPQAHQMAQREHLPQKKEEKMVEDRREQPSPLHHDALRSQQEALRHNEEKRHQTLQQEHILRHQIMMKEKGGAADHHPQQHPQYQHGHHQQHGLPQPEHLKKQYPMYVYPPKSVSASTAPSAPAAAMSTTQSSGSSSSSPGMTSSGHAIKQEPNFSLYGYQPFQHSGIQYISKETLYSQGLKDDKGGLHPQHQAHALKDESKGHMAAMHAQRTASPHGLHSKVSPPPLIKDAKPGSVIVENKPKETDLRQHPGDRQHPSQHPERHQSPHGLPPPAHSHHGMSGSITLGTALSPRQQTKGPDGRPTGPVAYGGHPQSRPGSGPHPGHMPSHIHGLPPGHGQHGMMQQQGGSRDHSRASPHSSHQLASAGVMLPMDLHKHVPLPGSAAVSAASSVSVGDQRDQRSHGQPHHAGSAVHPGTTLTQSPVSLPPKSSLAAHSYNLIQQGLVPNPIYSHGATGAPGQRDATVVPGQREATSLAGHRDAAGMPAHRDPTGVGHRDAAGMPSLRDPTAASPSQHPLQHQHSPPSTGQKRRSQKDSEPMSCGMSSGAPLTHHKKSRIAEAMAASHPPTLPGGGGPSSVPSGATLNSVSSGYSQHGQPHHAPATLPQSSTSPLVRTTAPSSTSTGFMDSFRSFVENTVQSAFYQDQELANNKALQQRNPQKNVVGASHVMSTQASPMPSTVSVSSPQAMTSSGVTPSTTSSSPFATTATTQAMPPTSVFTSASVYQIQHHQGIPPPSSSPASIVGGSVLPHSSLPLRPGPASTPGGASVSSTSSIVDTINRVANGYVESDSDTLSAPSPPPQRADVTPSPTCRPANHKAFKKAWLQRYSDEDKEKDTASTCTPIKMECSTPPVPEECSTPPVSELLPEGSKAGEPVKECYVNCSYISPTKEGGSKSPISLLAKDFRKGDEEDSTTSASEAESQQGLDGTTKRRMKTPTRRRSTGNAGNKKPKLSDEDKSTSTTTTATTPPPAATTTPPPAATTSATTQQMPGGKKRFSRKGREGVKDSTNKGLSDDEAVKDRIENEVKSRQVLHNQHHNKPHASSATSHAKAVIRPEIVDTATSKPDDEEDEVVKKEDNVKGEATTAENSEKTTESSTPTTTSVSSPSMATTVSNSTSSTTTVSNTTTTTSSKGKKTGTEVSDGESTPKENKKRGRKARESKKDKERDATPPRTENLSAILASKPLNKTAIVKLKKTLEPFIQDSACPEIAPKLMKCRECKLTSHQRNKKIPNIFCRFYAFRRLRYNQKAILAIAGFSEPSDADKDDIELWMPRLPVAMPLLDVLKAKYVIQYVGDQFCELVEQEKEAMSWVSPDTKVAWKRAVQGVREMCDVCDTTLFNMHWACHKCGFVVCIDCYRQRTRKSGGCMDVNCKTCDSIGQKWLTCSINRQAHEADKLMITQIIPSDALWVVGRMIHEVRDKWKVRSNCPCGRGKNLLLPPKNGINPLLASIKNSPERDNGDSHRPVLNGNVPGNGDDHKLYKNQTTNVNGSPPGSLSPLSLLANVASMENSENSRDKKILSRMKEALEFGSGHYNPLEDGKDDDEKSPANCSTLRELLTKTAGRMKPNPENSKKSKTTLDDIIQQVVERNLPKDSDLSSTPLLKHYIPKSGSTVLPGRDTPIRCYTLSETSVLYPDVPHSWLDSGRLLRLHDPRHRGNLKIWQQQWLRGQPVLVSNCHKRMTRNLWMPETFAREFGEIENDLVNCRTGVVLVGHQMKHFWEGFEYAKKRLKDEKGRKMILKLKDWPATEDFSEVLPGRFQDLMNGLPLPEYTHRNGMYNLASRLPDFFVKPDLGPKMYNAYGSALYTREGTTNLHLDISDAVNVIVFVGIAHDDDVDHVSAASKAMDEAGCDNLTKRRVNDTEEFPGALWHIFDALDADKIRDMLNKIAKERGETIEPHHDPIHDQSWYLDEVIRKRLLEEYNVQGYTILQCLGDAVFIPAGAPHQVRNLHSCIKAAEDFVSPENVSYCFKMTQEFRRLSDTHSNHEDKLQVKNIIYHTVKDAVAILREASP